MAMPKQIYENNPNRSSHYKELRSEEVDTIYFHYKNKCSYSEIKEITKIHIRHISRYLAAFNLYRDRGKTKPIRGRCSTCGDKCNSLKHGKYLRIVDGVTITERLCFDCYVKDYVPLGLPQGWRTAKYEC